jgi:ABC-type arginine transport system permease subunit
MMEAAPSFETLENFYRTTRRNIPEALLILSLTFKALMAVNMKITGFWDMKRCSLVDIYRRVEDLAASILCSE